MKKLIISIITATTLAVGGTTAFAANCNGEGTYCPSRPCNISAVSESSEYSCGNGYGKGYCDVQNSYAFEQCLNKSDYAQNGAKSRNRAGIETNGTEKQNDNKSNSDNKGNGANGNCPNNGQCVNNGNCQNNGECINDGECVNKGECPNDGVRPMDGTGYKKGNNGGANGCKNK